MNIKVSFIAFGMCVITLLCDCSNRSNDLLGEENFYYHQVIFDLHDEIDYKVEVLSYRYDSNESNFGLKTIYQLKTMIDSVKYFYQNGNKDQMRKSIVHLSNNHHHLNSNLSNIQLFKYKSAKTHNDTFSCALLNTNLLIEEYQKAYIRYSK